MKKHPLIITCLIIVCLVFLTTCSKDASLPNSVESGSEIQLRSQNTHLVKEGESIQAAVDAAEPGDVISILPGTYAESIVVNKPNLTIIGKGNEEVVIINPGEEEDGIRVNGEGDGFELSNVVIRDFLENGIFLIGVDGFRLEKVITINDGEYGIFPVLSQNGEVIDCEAQGHFDTGIYIGLSQNILISHCRASGNVVGFEIENCNGVIVTENESHHNTNGFLIILLPFLPVKSSAEIEVHHNVAHHNNLPNFAPPDEPLAGAVPSGTGILVVGTDQTIVSDNEVHHNNFAGIGVANTVIIGALAGIPPEAILADIEPFPDGVEVRDNLVINNGTEPSPIEGFPPADLLWDGSGSGNCWSNNNFRTSFPSPLPSCL